MCFRATPRATESTTECSIGNEKRKGGEGRADERRRGGRERSITEHLKFSKKNLEWDRIIRLCTRKIRNTEKLAGSLSFIAWMTIVLKAF